LCQSLGAEVHRLALQVQVLEESDTLAIEAEVVRVRLHQAYHRLTLQLPLYVACSVWQASLAPLCGCLVG